MAHIIDDIFKKLNKLISIPKVISECKDFMNKKIFIRPPIFYNLNDLVSIINNDPVLVTKIIGRANSSFFYRGNLVDDLKEAIIRIGFIELKNILYEQSSEHIMKELINKFIYSGIDNKVFLRQIIGYAKTAEKTIKYLTYNDVYSQILIPYKQELISYKYVIYYMSLLQDIGMIIFDQFDNSYKSILTRSGGDIDRLVKLEADEYQKVDHLQLGAEILKRWNFPNYFVETVRNHHKINNNETNICKILGNIIVYSDNMFYYHNIDKFEKDTPWYIRVIDKSDVINGLGRLFNCPVDEKTFTLIDEFKYENPFDEIDSSIIE